MNNQKDATMIDKIFCFIHNVIDLLAMLTKNITLIFRTHSFEHFKRLPLALSKTAYIFANGPSASLHFDEIKNLSKEEYEVFVMNFFANTEDFLRIKPQNYCLVDPAFISEVNEEKIKNLLDVFNTKVDWNMTLYVNYFRSTNTLKSLWQLTNPHINIVHINTISECKSFRNIMNWCYDHNLASPIIGTVLSLCIFVGIKRKFKEIRLYGVEHSFFKNIMVNEKNQVCNFEEHYYDKEIMVHPIKMNMAEYIQDKLIMFIGHNQLRTFADYKGVKIINCTPNSWIDSYEKE